MGEKIRRERIRQDSRPMNKMHKVHSKFLMLLVFTERPDLHPYPLIMTSSVSTPGMALPILMLMQVILQTNTNLWVWAHAHTSQSRLLLLWETNRAEAFPTLVPLWINSVTSLPFSCHGPLQGFTIRWDVRPITLNWGEKKWADLLETQRTEWLRRGHCKNERLFEMKTLVTCHVCDLKLLCK